MSTDLEQINAKYVLINKNSDKAIGRVELVHNPEKPQKIYIRRIIPFYVEAYGKMQGAGIPGIPEIEEVHYYYDPSSYPQDVSSDIPNTTCVIEEFVDGDNLDEFKANNPARFPLSEKEILQIFEELCDILVHLHKREIIHRDIKPANIRIDGKSLRVKLIDFGIAKALDFSEEDDFALGTDGFAAPEQRDGHSVYQSDLFSLGKTMRWLLPLNYHGVLEGIIAKCLEYDLEQRVASAEELRKMLREARGTIAPEQAPQPKAQAVPSKNTSWYKYFLYAILGLFVLGGGYFLAPQSQFLATSVIVKHTTSPASNYVTTYVKEVAVVKRSFATRWLMDDKIEIWIRVKNTSDEKLRTVIIEGKLGVGYGSSKTIDFVTDLEPGQEKTLYKPIRLDREIWSEAQLLELSDEQAARQVTVHLKQLTDSKDVTHY